MLLVLHLDRGTCFLPVMLYIFREISGRFRPFFRSTCAVFAGITGNFGCIRLKALFFAVVKKKNNLS